jgi:hypothetical protein
VLHRKKIRRGADDLDVGVPIPALHLEILVLLWLDGENVRGTLVDRLHVIDRDAFSDVRLDAAAPHPRRVDLKSRRTEFGDAIADRLLRAVAERDHCDHRGDPDDDAEHRERGSQQVCPQRGKRHTKYF